MRNAMHKLMRKKIYSVLRFVFVSWNFGLRSKVFNKDCTSLSLPSLKTCHFYQVRNQVGQRYLVKYWKNQKKYFPTTQYNNELKVKYFYISFINLKQQVQVGVAQTFFFFLLLNHLFSYKNTDLKTRFGWNTINTGMGTQVL